MNDQTIYSLNLESQRIHLEWEEKKDQKLKLNLFSSLFFSQWRHPNVHQSHCRGEDISSHGFWRHLPKKKILISFHEFCCCSWCHIRTCIWLTVSFLSIFAHSIGKGLCYVTYFLWFIELSDWQDFFDKSLWFYSVLNFNRS